MYSALDPTNDSGDFKLLWEDFITDRNDLTSGIPIRKTILNSWKRCYDDGVNPRKTHAQEGLSSFELMRIQNESQLFLIAKPIIETVFHNLMGTGYLITLNDEKGRMIFLKGEMEILRKTEKMNFGVGMDWSEAAAGTNAIGTSIITKMPMQIFATEHFCEGFQSMTCSAAPIFQPYTRKIIGVIDITGLWPNGQPHTLGIAVALAQAIEQELAKTYIEKYSYLMEYYHQQKLRWRNSSLLVVSDDVLLINGSDDLLKVFELNKMMDLHEHPHLSTIAIELNEQNCTNNLSELNKINLLGFRMDEIQRIELSGELIGYVLLFEDRLAYADNLLPTTKYNFVGHSTSLQEILNKVETVAVTDVPVLIIGETGTGKEVITNIIHQESSRKEQSFIAMNCGAIQKELIASELFGYESGTFTGGIKEGKKGRFEEANGGTLFLDEIGEMPLDQQALLLRAIEENEITRLGSSKVIKVNVRIIAATNRDLQEMVEQGLFRRDLYYRLNVITLEIPPLRAREGDILQLSNYFIKKFAKKHKIASPSELTVEAVKILTNYEWPGNVRELRNVIEHAVIFSMKQTMIEPTHFPDYLLKHMDDKEEILPLMDNLEKQQIDKLLKMRNWNISAVSKELKMARSTLYRKIEKYEIVRA